MAKVSRQGEGLKAISEALKAANLETSVGWFPGAKYQDGTSVAYVATIHEYGATKQKIPPRPFMRPTIDEKKNEWMKLAKSGAKAMVNGNASAKQVMSGLGLAAQGDIAKKITEISSPPLKSSTVENKKRKLTKGKKVGSLTKPLVETGLMLSSLTHTVESK